MEKHEIFNSNPNLKEAHFTSDGQAFYNDNDAKLHAKSLKDNKVELVLNPSFIEVVVTEETTEETVEETVEETPAETFEETAEETTEETVEETPSETVEETAEDVKVVKLEKMNSSQLIEFAKANGLTLDENLKNADKVKSIKSQLNAKE